MDKVAATPVGSSAVQGALWSARAHDFTMLEPKMLPQYESALADLDIHQGARLLDVGCGAGLFLRLAEQRGAVVAGIDAAPGLVEIAHGRVPRADVRVGEMEELPFGDGVFDVVTGFNAFQFAANPARALTEAGRVAVDGAPVVISTWGRPDQCEAAAYVQAVASLLPPPPANAPGPFALSEPDALEAFAEAGGLTPRHRREVLCVWAFPDSETASRALKSTGFAVRAITEAGEEPVDEAIRHAIEPFATADGGYRLENVFTYLVARA